MSKQIDVTVPDSETLSSEKSKRFTVRAFFISLNFISELCFSFEPTSNLPLIILKLKQTVTQQWYKKSPFWFLDIKTEIFVKLPLAFQQRLR